MSRCKVHLYILTFLFALALVPTSATGQTLTQVSGTITDPNGLPYSNAQIVIQLAGGGSTPMVTPCASSPCNVTNPGPIQADASGKFSIALWANGSITPGSTQWSFLVQEPGVAPPWGFGPKSFTLTTTISGATDDLSSAMDALAPALTPAFSGGGTPCTTADFAVQINDADAFGCNANFTYTPSSGLVDHSETGVFTNGTNNFYNVFGLNACDPAVGINAFYAIAGISGDTLTDGLSSCINLPSTVDTVTNVENSAISAYAYNANAHKQNPFGGGDAYGIGFKGLSYCTANNTACEAFTGEVLDSTGLSGVMLIGSEMGLAPQNTSDTVYGYLASPFGTVQPGNDQEIAFYVNNTSGGNLATSGFECGISSLLAVSTNFKHCFVLSPFASGNNRISQALEFNTTNGSGGLVHTSLVMVPDANSNGGWLRMSKEGATNGSTVAVFPDHAGANGLSPNANLTFASCTLSSGACSYTFINAYLSAPVCVANGQTTANSVSVATSTTAVTVTSSSGSDTQVVSIACGPQAN